MPEAHRDKIAQIPGVAAVCPVNWFGGIYKEEKPQYFFAQFYVDTGNIFDVMSEFSVPPDQLAAFKQDRSGAACGAKLAQKHGWKIGDAIELKGTIWPVNPRLILKAIYTGTEELTLYFHREYVEEAMGRPGIVGTYFVRINSPEDAPRIMEAIDNTFANSAAPTKTETEKAFQAGFISMMGNVTGLITGVGLVVVFAITLITANTMAMAARERTTEVSVMKAIGFTPGLILFLVLAESGLIATAGGTIGVFAAKFFCQFALTGFAGFLQDMSIPLGTLVFCIVLSSIIGLFSGGVPAFNAARIRIIDGLRQVG